MHLLLSSFLFVDNFYSHLPLYLEYQCHPPFKTKIVLVSKTTEIQRFDVIVFDAPDIDGDHYIKRVIGLPGDSIEMKNDVLYINGEALEERI